MLSSAFMIKDCEVNLKLKVHSKQENIVFHLSM